MAETGKNTPIDLKKLVTKEELRESLKDVVRKKDLEKLLKKDEPDQSTGLKKWFTANWAGVVVAFIALLTSVYSSCEKEKHDKLSVRPHISLGFYANTEGAGWARTISGLGPAIINVFEVTVDGKAVHTWDAVLLSLGIDPSATKNQFTIPTPGTYLLPSSEATGWLFFLRSLLRPGRL